MPGSSSSSSLERGVSWRSSSCESWTSSSDIRCRWPRRPRRPDRLPRDEPSRVGVSSSSSFWLKSTTSSSSSSTMSSFSARWRRRERGRSSRSSDFGSSSRRWFRPRPPERRDRRPLASSRSSSFASWRGFRVGFEFALTSTVSSAAGSSSSKSANDLKDKGSISSMLSVGAELASAVKSTSRVSVSTSTTSVSSSGSGPRSKPSPSPKPLGLAVCWAFLAGLSFDLGLRVSSVCGSG